MRGRQRARIDVRVARHLSQMRRYGQGPHREGHVPEGHEREHKAPHFGDRYAARDMIGMTIKASRITGEDQVGIQVSNGPRQGRFDLSELLGKPAVAKIFLDDASDGRRPRG